MVFVACAVEADAAGLLRRIEEPATANSVNKQVAIDTTRRKLLLLLCIKKSFFFNISYLSSGGMYIE